MADVRSMFGDVSDMTLWRWLKDADLELDRYKQAEVGEAIDKAGIRAQVVWRDFGFKDGGEETPIKRQFWLLGMLYAGCAHCVRLGMKDKENGRFKRD